MQTLQLPTPYSTVILEMIVMSVEQTESGIKPVKTTSTQRGFYSLFSGNFEIALEWDYKEGYLLPSEQLITVPIETVVSWEYEEIVLSKFN